MKKFIAAVALIAVFLGGCKSDSTSANTTTSIPPSNTMKATVSGSNATFFDGATRQSYQGQSALVIAGIDSVAGRNLTVTLVNVTSTGTFNIGSPNLPTTALVLVEYTYADATSSPQVYTSPTVPGLSAVGTVTVTQFDSLAVKGTFNATVSRQSGNSGPQTLAITNGAFNASIFH